MSHNVFYKHPKSEDKNILTYEYLHKKFEKFGPIKSTKISLNGDYSKRGFAFVCFQDDESTARCLKELGPAGEVIQFQAKDAREVAGKIVNNLYFKNIPQTMTQADVKKLFEPFGDIKSLVMFKNDFGQYGFVCYEDKTKKDKMHGSNAVKKAVEALTDKDLGGGAKLYVRSFLNKEEREKEKFVETIRYKNSKKRCNLYVKNFPASWTENELRNLFQSFGEIENVRLEKGFTNNIFAFVCFKKPDACSVAKQALHGQTYDGKGLIINHYEIKELRDLQLEEIQDKRAWEKYIASNGGGLQWNHLTSQPNLTHIIQQLLSLIQQQQNQQNEQMRGGPKPMGNNY
jgi:polyadenylate-binding protein